MPNTVNYATSFEKELKQKYSRESCTDDLTTQNVQFVNAKTIKIPYITLGGYKGCTAETAASTVSPSQTTT